MVGAAVVSSPEAEQIFRFGMGRIFRLMSRPFQLGDVEQYEAARRAVLDACDPLPKPWEHRLLTQAELEVEAVRHSRLVLGD